MQLKGMRAIIGAMLFGLMSFENRSSGGATAGGYKPEKEWKPNFSFLELREGRALPKKEREQYFKKLRAKYLAEHEATLPEIPADYKPSKNYLYL